MTIFNYNKSHKNLVPKLPPASDRFYANSNIDSSDKNNLSNKDSEPARSANYPKTNSGIRLISFNRFIDDGDKDNRPNGDVIIAPVDKPKLDSEFLSENNEIYGIMHNIWDWDILLIMGNDRVDDGFKPMNMVVTKNIGLMIRTGATPVNSADVVSITQFRILKEQHQQYLIEKLKNFPPFTQIIDIKEREADIAQYLENNNYLPKFSAPLREWLGGTSIIDINTIKYTYCKYDPVTFEFLECGLAESHELSYMETINNELLLNNQNKAYHLVSYPVPLYKNEEQPMCYRCHTWVVFCWDGSPILEAYDPDEHDDNVLLKNLKLFNDKEKAQLYLEELLATNDCESGGVLSTNKAYYFNTNTKQWEYK